MKCPYCNEEMKMGYIKSSHSIHWGETKELGELFLPDDIKLSKFTWKDWYGGFVEAYYCDGCKKIIVSLE